jgi:hypothetical protein
MMGSIPITDHLADHVCSAAVDFNLNQILNVPMVAMFFGALKQ